MSRKLTFLLNSSMGGVNMEVKKINNEENAQWLLLCDYVKKDIMQYEDNQKLSKEMYLRLRGLKAGKMIDNNKIKSSAQYSFEIILYTFKICKSKIITATQPKTFKTEYFLHYG